MNALYDPYRSALGAIAGNVKLTDEDIEVLRVFIWEEYGVLIITPEDHNLTAAESEFMTEIAQRLNPLEADHE